MKKLLFLEGERVLIRPPKISDVPNIQKNAKSLKDPQSRVLTQRAESFVRRARYELKKHRRFTFVIDLKGSEKAIGVVELYKVDYKNKNAALGYWLGKKYRGKGIMSEAVLSILKFGFKRLKLHRIYAKVLEDNAASRRVLEKCGFTYEGTAREARLVGKIFKNEQLFAILKEDFERQNKLSRT
ncbi:MAG: GNAT family protein [Candidatus Diapherotrites archaeon]